MLLYETVLERLGADAIRTGHVLERVASEGERAQAWLRRRPDDAVFEADADFIIAADGIHSIARRQWYPDEGPPKFAGQLLWRATTVAPKFLTGRTMIMAGHQDQKFVCYPIADNADGTCMINWIAERRIGGGRAAACRPTGIARSTGRRSRRFSRLEIRLARHPRADRRRRSVYEFPMVDRDPLPHGHSAV